MHLMSLERGGGGSARVRLALARCLVELGREGEALDQAHAALQAEPSPAERIQAAVYLKEFGEPEEALNEAFQAFRGERRDPRIQRTFASLVMTSGVDLPAPEMVAGTRRQLRHKDGSIREHTILAGQPIDPASHEMNEADAATAGLIGRRVGDSSSGTPGIGPNSNGRSSRFCRQRCTWLSRSCELSPITFRANPFSWCRSTLATVTRPEIGRA